eukprot:CAMPEP_0174755850 /NCGR_PEP_ID=MMETSP1094-20130205/106457_1 /TAXON_ID=156173 /ORGANISM="Chrysochromulina brevifilum, Strain UTEX LB 985" /LENGTH=153 /DNA_ID=CAMNT_0015961749 /DNA_START=281 /DNA_END=744 /DNA_ORIENTATION=+
MRKGTCMKLSDGLVADCGVSESSRSLYCKHRTNLSTQKAKAEKNARTVTTTINETASGAASKESFNSASATSNDSLIFPVATRPISAGEAVVERKVATVLMAAVASAVVVQVLAGCKVSGVVVTLAGEAQVVTLAGEAQVVVPATGGVKLAVG